MGAYGAWGEFPPGDRDTGFSSADRSDETEVPDIFQTRVEELMDASPGMTRAEAMEMAELETADGFVNAVRASFDVTEEEARQMLAEVDAEE